MTLFTEAQMEVIKPVIIRYGLEEMQSKPGIYRAGKSPHIQQIDTTRMSEVHPGLPVIGISDNISVQEDNTGNTIIESIRQEIKNGFEMLAKKEKTKKPIVDKELMQKIGDAQKGKDKKPGLKTDILTKDIEVTEGSGASEANHQETQEVIKTDPKQPEAKSETAKPLTVMCSICGFELSHAEAMEEFEDGIARKDMRHADCKYKKPEPKKAEVVQSTNKTSVEPARIPIRSITQKGTMIKGFQPSLAEIGKIKIGKKGTKTTGSGHRLPIKLDHFEITTLIRDEKGDFLPDDIMKSLGDKPTSLNIMLLFNDPTLNFTTSYAQYKGGKCACRGDGENATLEDGNSIECNPETCPIFAEKKCKPNGILSVILADSPRLGGVYKFRTTSFHSIRSILSSMFFLATQTGGVLSMIPLKLTLSPKQVSPEGIVTTVYVVNIEFAGTATDLLQKTFEVQKYQSAMRENIVRLENTARHVLTAPETPEEQKAVQEEWYPDQTEATK